jgi:CubicO group peptidase (beta-lactamase class C family)
MQSTPSDMLDWLTKLVGGGDAVLSTPSRAKMLTMVKTDATTLRYGLGVVEWGAQATKGHGVGYGHMGSVAGFASEVVYHPDSKVAIVAFGNDTTADASELVAVAYAGLRALE